MGSWDKKSDKKLAMSVSVNSMAANAILSAFKFAAGIIGHSGAMISDAVHSFSDVFSTIVVMVGISVSGRESDEEHRYGHERMECVAAVILADLLLVTGVGIGINGINKIRAGNYEDMAVPGILALVAAVVSIVVKEGMYWYTRSAAKRIHSGALMADAWHHRSDALSSVGSLAGITAARLGFPVFDPVAAVVISVLILKAAYDIFRDTFSKLVDKSINGEVLVRMKEVIGAEEGVLGIDDIKTRMFGSKVYVDIEIQADGEQTLTEAHRIAERVHDGVEAGFPEVKHCMVHVNPAQGSGTME